MKKIFISIVFILAVGSYLCASNTQVSEMALKFSSKMMDMNYTPKANRISHISQNSIHTHEVTLFAGVEYVITVSTTENIENIDLSLTDTKQNVKKDDTKSNEATVKVRLNKTSKYIISVSASDSCFYSLNVAFK